MSEDELVQKAIHRGGRELRLARVADAEALIAIDRAVILDGRGVVLSLDQVHTVDEARCAIDETYVAMSAHRATSTWVVEVEGRVVASGTLRQLGPRACEHVAVVAVSVHPDHQRRGHGRAILGAMIEHARGFGVERVELYVRADNERALALYQAVGFAHEATRRRFVKIAEGQYVDDHVYCLWIG